MKSSQSKLGELPYAENHENVGLHRHPMTNPKCHFLGRYKKKTAASRNIPSEKACE